MSLGKDRTVAAWNLIFQALTIGLAMVSGLVMVPLYVKYLPLEVYGAWLASGNLLAWISLFDPGISTLIQQRAAQQLGARNHAALGQTLAVGLIATFCVMIVLAIGGGFVGWKLQSILGVKRDVMIQGVTHAYSLALLGAVLALLANALIAFNMGLQSAIGAGLSTTIAWGASIVATALMLKAGFGVVSMGWAAIIMSVVRTLGAAIDLAWRWRLVRARIWTGLSGVWSFFQLLREVLLARITGAILNNSEGYVLTRITGAAPAASFLLFKRLPDVGRLLLERPTMALLSPFSRLVGTGDGPAVAAVMARILRINIWLTGLYLVGFGALQHGFLRIWVGEKFWLGSTAGWIVVGAAATAANVSNFYHLLFSLGEIKRSSRLITIGGILTLVTGVLGTYFMGPIGYAIALGVCSLGVVLAGLLPALRTRLKSAADDPFRGLGRVLVGAAVAMAGGIGAGAMISVNSWPGLVLAALGISSVYAFLLAVCSADFRREGWGMLQQFLQFGRFAV